MDGFVCESIQPIPSDHLTLSIATVIGHGKASGRTMAKARKIATTLSASASIPELMSCGLTETQSALISAAIHIGQELCSAPLRPGERFSNSREIFQRYRARFYAARKEYFVALNLNSKNQLIREVLVSVGSLSTSVVHPREVFAPAVRDSSAAILFLHNHPLCGDTHNGCYAEFRIMLRNLRQGPFSQGTSNAEVRIIIGYQGKQEPCRLGGSG
jgi:hypothetical protein